MHPSSSSSSSFSNFQEVPFLTTYKVTLPRMTNKNKTNTGTEGGGGGAQGAKDHGGLEQPDETSTAKKQL